MNFPPLHFANKDGLLLVGGDLLPSTLLKAYSLGIFPWYSADEPILWWSPNPRFVLFPEKVQISKTMKSILKKDIFQISYNQAFEEVIFACGAVPRQGQDGTWITDEMMDAYLTLHRMGWAQSVEVWQNEVLVGGLYGIRMGDCFFGESMFAKVSNASKFGFIKMCQKLHSENVQIIDCQVFTSHLESLGAGMISRDLFVSIVANGIKNITF